MDKIILGGLGVLSIITILILLLIDHKKELNKAVLYILFFVLFISAGAFGILTYGFEFALFSPIFLLILLLMSHLTKKTTKKDDEILDDNL